METNNTTELIDKLSDAFSKLIVDNLTREQLEEVNVKNDTEAYKNCCATQDYFDANEFMAEAFQSVTGHEINVQDETNIDLWNAAWKQSKDLGFSNGWAGLSDFTDQP